MKWKLFYKILLGLVAFAILLIFVFLVFVQPWAERQILPAINKLSNDYHVKAEAVDLSIFASAIELKNITITSIPAKGTTNHLDGKITSLRISGIKLIRILLKKDIYLRKVVVTGSSIEGRIPFPKKAAPPIISKQNIRIGSILFDTVNLSLTYDSTARAFSVKKGYFKMYDLKIERKDTLSQAMISEFDFSADELFAISSDSIYSFSAIGIRYFADSNALAADSFSIRPNYPDYEFASKHEYQKDRIEAYLSNIYFHGISPADYFKSGDLVSTYIEIGKLEMDVFRDKRKKFHHVDKPIVQDLMLDFPGKLQIDSIGFLDGNITYAEHVPEASDQGKINFNNLRAGVYNITNDTVYKKTEGHTELRAEALLMGKSKLSVHLKARLFDKNNVFTVTGSIADMQAEVLNPMLEYTAFMYATAGKMDGMNFQFTANNTKATGEMTLLYHDLNIAVKNKQTNDTTALKERIVSILANRQILNSNPLPRREVRVGTIDFERNPERFIIGYIFKSILSGMKSSLLRNPDKESEK
jgi:hypothetical protein